MKEVEVLIEVKDSKEKALNVLEQFGSATAQHVLDIYFYDQLRSDLQPGKNTRLNRSFRLRKKDEKISLAYKIDHFDKNDQWIYSDEHETRVDNFNEASNIIKHLGLQELIRIDNEKHIFKTSEYEIVFEDVKNLGYFLEVEKIHEVEDSLIEETKQKIRSFIQQLNINFGEELNAGKPELMLRKQKKTN